MLATNKTSRQEPMNRIVVYSLITGALIVMTATLPNTPSSAQTRSPLSLESDLKNPVMVTRGGRLEQARIMWDFLFNKPADTHPSGAIPVQALTTVHLMTAPDNTVYRLGHSTVLMKLQGSFWLTDPMFSHRASPVSFAGPERFHAPPIGIDQLPPIRSVIISHDHYDHLDHGSIMKLAEKTDYFLTPLGVGDIIIGWGYRRPRYGSWTCGRKLTLTASSSSPPLPGTSPVAACSTRTGPSGRHGPSLPLTGGSSSAAIPAISTASGRSARNMVPST